jgi:hypothetical protein
MRFFSVDFENPKIVTMIKDETVVLSVTVTSEELLENEVNVELLLSNESKLTTNELAEIQSEIIKVNEIKIKLEKNK